MWAFGDTKGKGMKTDEITTDLIIVDLLKHTMKNAIIFMPTQKHEICPECNGELYATEWHHGDWLFLCPKCERIVK